MKLHIIAAGALLAAAAILNPGPVLASPTNQSPTTSTAEAQREILASAPSPADLKVADLPTKMLDLTRCVNLGSVNYCLLLGFTTEEPSSAAWQTWVRSLSTQPASDTGDMPLKEIVRQRAALTEDQRAKVEADEIQAAMAALPKVLEIEKLRQEGFSSAPKGKQPNAKPQICQEPCTTLPTTYNMMSGFFNEQVESYFCGPATMQMIDWAGDGTKQSQDYIANNWLDTTTGGTSIGSMVSTVNNHTGWDSSSYAGPYAVVNVGNWSAAEFFSEHVTHIYLHGAPIVEHVMLKNEYFTYLHSDHNGHYQVGRGYTGRGSTTEKIVIFEPFDERDFSSSGNATGGSQAVPKGKMLDATKANSSTFGV